MTKRYQVQMLSHETGRYKTVYSSDERLFAEMFAMQCQNEGTPVRLIDTKAAA